MEDYVSNHRSPAEADDAYAPTARDIWHRVQREAVPRSHQRAPEHLSLWVPQTSFQMQVHGFAPFTANPCSLILLHPRFRFDRQVLQDAWLKVDEVHLPLSLLDRCGMQMQGMSQSLLPWMYLDAEAYINLRRSLALPSPLKETALERWAAMVLQLARVEWRKRPLPRQAIIETGTHPNRFALAQSVAARLDQVEARCGGLDELAERFGVSAFHLLRVFRRVIGTTPHQYYLQLRLRRALLQIDLGRERIVDIALAAGFSSHGHFSTAFRKAFGCSPLEFQRGQQRLAGELR
ncbi:helix-turn-helix transcriptional regulator [Pseudomarimonas arenosa]|uniref:Helix-turn-helix domain-containing protein n=1 Tax=Pseudomarimonas arenosa TaxID=2774145 RepID=A0AAW3ZJA7_9GAMM|nr:helix-turn-helix domain-containing protein [Pseudomarimonas arenosa]MBD8525604.1 helix-turn-helix domain-containing protein [Pseudomarimonas arenosa]